jgi:hypothetical protein
MGGHPHNATEYKGVGISVSWPVPKTPKTHLLQIEQISFKIVVFIAEIVECIGSYRKVEEKW